MLAGSNKRILPQSLRIKYYSLLMTIISDLHPSEQKEEQGRSPNNLGILSAAAYFAPR